VQFAIGVRQVQIGDPTNKQTYRRPSIGELSSEKNRSTIGGTEFKAGDPVHNPIKGRLTQHNPKLKPGSARYIEFVLCTRM